MKRPAAVLALAGLAFMGLWCLQAASGAPVMPSYLAAWLFCLALPAGALPLVMAGELAGAQHPLVPALRPLLALMPPVAVAAIPIALTLPQLYAWARAGDAGWFSATWFCLRLALCLAAWCALSVLLMRTPVRPRRALCIVGLMLHVVLVTMLATDAVLSLGTQMSAAGFGLLVLAAQCGVAVAAALLFAAGAQAAALLLGCLVAWGFCHFIQYLVVWSADKPDEITWYLQRDGALGQASVWLGVLAFAPASLLAWRRASSTRLAVLAACMILLVHAVESLWLVTPSLRGGFFLTLPDVGAVAGLAMLCAAFLLWRRPSAPVGAA